MENEEIPLKTEIKRDEKGRIVAGSGAINPNGRPRGKTLKEFARQYLMSLSDEDKLAYLAELPKEIVWRMSEGNPHNTQDLTSNGQTVGVPILANVPSDLGNKEDNGVEEKDKGSTGRNVSE